MDIFSCKHFDHDQAVDFICKEFFVEKYKCTFFERGNKDLE
jgi:S-adenosylmethionine/arginine decarboxylase-like enzyme